MKLRDQLPHGQGDFYNWPPIWTNTHQDPTDKPQGEIGNLQDVLMSEDDYDVLFIAMSIRAVDIWAQWDLRTPFCVGGFTFSYSRISVFPSKRSATSIYHRIAINQVSNTL